MTDFPRESPHLRAICRDGSCWILPLTHRASFLAAWMNGRPFWEGIDGYGSPVVIKLADITGTIDKTAAAIALVRSEDAEEKRRLKAEELIDPG